MALSDIVQVTITKESASVSRAGFGVPMILGYFSTTHFADRAKVYTDLDGLEADGFGSAHFVHKAAAALMAQNPKVSSYVVGRRALPPTRSITLTPTASPLALTDYKVTINDQVASYTTDATPTVAEITAGLAAAINALMPAAWVTTTAYAIGDRRKNGGNIYVATQAGTSGATGPSGTRSDITDGTVKWAYVGPTVTATDTGPGTSIVVLQDTAGAPFVCKAEKRALIEQKDNSADPGIATDLSAVRTDLSGNDDWYALLTDAHSGNEIKALAAAIESLRKVFGASCADDEIPTSATTDLASVLAGLDYARTYLLWHEDSASFPEAAWSGKVLPLDPGSETWKFKTLSGISASKLTSSETAYLVAKSCNHYQTVAGINITAEGVTSSGEFNDVTRFIDWLQADIEEHVFARLAASQKIPFTSQGIAVIESELRGSLLRGIRVGGLAQDPAPAVTVPLISEVDPLDKSARTLRNVTFSATLAGAIHKLIISGRLSV